MARNKVLTGMYYSRKLVIDIRIFLGRCSKKYSHLFKGYLYSNYIHNIYTYSKGYIVTNIHIF